MELSDEKFKIVYSCAELFAVQIYDALKEGNLDDALYSITDKIINDLPELQHEVVEAINKHLDNPDLLLPVLTPKYNSETDSNLDWQGAKAKLQRFMR